MAENETKKSRKSYETYHVDHCRVVVIGGVGGGIYFYVSSKTIYIDVSQITGAAHQSFAGKFRRACRRCM